MLNLRKPSNLALLCYMCTVWVLPEVALVLFFALLEARIARRAHRYRHGMGNNQAMARGHVIRRLDSNCTGNKTGKDDGEDGRVDEKLHDWLPPGG